MSVRAFYGSKISQNMSKSPEGYLICLNVPIARTGWYEYMGKEIGLDGEDADKVIDVYRDPDEVFSPASIASFQGKSVTDDHPPEAVSTENNRSYDKGAVMNVRQGTGKDSDLLIADLVVKDPYLIKKIEDGKREISCGYECEYEPDGDGSYVQKRPLGNHVAVVENGRAGARVAVKDKSIDLPNNEVPKGETRMSKKIVVPSKNPINMTRILAAVGLKQFAIDAEPEEIVDAMDAMAAEQHAAPPAAAPAPAPAAPAAPAPDPVAALSQQVAKLTELVTGLVHAAKPDPTGDAFDEAIAELEGEGTEDEETEVIESNDDPGPISNPEDRPKSAFTGDNAYKIAALNAMKPVLAKIADPVERKTATDAAIAAIRGVKAKTSKNSYGAMSKPAKQTNDTSKVTVDYSDLGKSIAAKHNPHYKEKN